MKLRLLIVALVAIGMAACNNKPENILPKDKFADVIYDIHKMDALLTDKKLFDDQMYSDSSASHYNYIWKKHGITFGEFEVSLNYYSRNAEEFLVIYDTVVNRFDREREKYQKLATNSNEEVDYTINLWSQKDHLAQPEDGPVSAIPFTIPTTTHGNYILSADIVVYPADSSNQGNTTISAYYADGSYETVTSDFHPKDGEWHTYKIQITTNKQKKLDHIKGAVLSFYSMNGEKFSKVKNIKLILDSGKKDEELE